MDIMHYNHRPNVSASDAWKNENGNGNTECEDDASIYIYYRPSSFPLCST